MISHASAFLAIALIAAVLGFVLLTGVGATVAKIACLVFLVIAFVSLAIGGKPND